MSRRCGVFSAGVLAGAIVASLGSGAAAQWLVRLEQKRDWELHHVPAVAQAGH